MKQEDKDRIAQYAKEAKERASKTVETARQKLDDIDGDPKDGVSRQVWNIIAISVVVGLVLGVLVRSCA